MAGEIKCRSEDKILANKKEWLRRCAKLEFDRTQLLKYLDAVDYWHAPYSSSGPYNYDGGLCEFSLKLGNDLGQLCEAYRPGQYSVRDILSVSLFYGRYSAELYEKYFKNTKVESGEWVQVPAYRYRENRAVYGDLMFSSYMTAKHFYPGFTDEQTEALVLAGTKQEFAGDINEIKKSYPLVVLTQMATQSTLYL